MKTRIETITPALAAELLKSNPSNRKMRQAWVDQLATEMRAGRFAITHQGIAIDENGFLLDGQHRLQAVIESGCTVKMMVTRGVPATVNSNGVFTMDVIDNGRRRTCADQLHLMHGVQNANLVAAAARSIGLICASDKVSGVSVGQAKELLAIYGPQIEKIIDAVRSFKPMRRGPVVGTLAFCAKASPQLVPIFAAAAATGESLRAGDPALALRNHLVNHGVPGGENGVTLLIEWVGNAVSNAVQNAKLNSIRRGVAGIDFFKSKQRANVEKVRGILGAE